MQDDCKVVVIGWNSITPTSTYVLVTPLSEGVGPGVRAAPPGKLEFAIVLAKIRDEIDVSRIKRYR